MLSFPKVTVVVVVVPFIAIIRVCPALTVAICVVENACVSIPVSAVSAVGRNVNALVPAFVITKVLVVAPVKYP